MNSNPASTQTFWMVFVVVFLATLFIPVWPIYKGPILLWVAPIWMAYVITVLDPLLFYISVPIIAIHGGVSYLPHGISLR